MNHTVAWPADLQRQEDGSMLVSFSDVPEALTEGATESEAMTLARGLPGRGAWRLRQGAARDTTSVPGGGAGVGPSAGAGRRQDRALRSHACAGNGQYGARPATWACRRRGAAADRP